MRLISGSPHKEAVAKWVASRIGMVGAAGFVSFNAIGVVDKHDNPLCGVVFHDYQPEFKTLSFSIAADSPRWATRNIIRQLLAYPFDELQVQKLWTATPHTNERALRLVKGVGFTPEATLARHFGEYGHAIISRMFRKDYMRLYGEPHAKKTNTARAA